MTAPLPERTLWTTAVVRAKWFTGEIHVVDKNVQPTTPRSDFIENAARVKLYVEAQKRIPPILKNLAQEISDNRKAFTDAKTIQQKNLTNTRRNWRTAGLNGRTSRSSKKTSTRASENWAPARTHPTKRSEPTRRKSADWVRRSRQHSMTLRSSNRLLDNRSREGTGYVH